MIPEHSLAYGNAGDYLCASDFFGTTFNNPLTHYLLTVAPCGLCKAAQDRVLARADLEPQIAKVVGQGMPPDQSIRGEEKPASCGRSDQSCRGANSPSFMKSDASNTTPRDSASRTSAANECLLGNRFMSL